MHASSWSEYLDSVYGLATLTFPLDMRRFTFFYADVFARATLKPDRLPLNLKRLPLLGRAMPTVLGANLTAMSRAMNLDDVVVPAARPGRHPGRRNFCGRRPLDAYALLHEPPFSAAAMYNTVWFYAHKESAAAYTTSAAAASTGARTSVWQHPPDGYPSHSRVEVFHCSELAAGKGVQDYW